MNDETRKRIMLVMAGMLFISLAWIVVEVVPNEEASCFKGKSVTVLLGNDSFSFLQTRFNGPNWVDCDKLYWECQKVKMQTNFSYPIWLKTELMNTVAKQGVMDKASAGEWCKVGI